MCKKGSNHSSPFYYQKGGKKEMKIRNTLGDLNNHLFMQLERLNDEDIKGEELQEEIQRAKAVSSIATQIISNGSLVLKAKTFTHEYLCGEPRNEKMPPMLKASFFDE